MDQKLIRNLLDASKAEKEKIEMLMNLIKMATNTSEPSKDLEETKEKLQRMGCTNDERHTLKALLGMRHNFALQRQVLEKEIEILKSNPYPTHCIRYFRMHADAHHSLQISIYRGVHRRWRENSQNSVNKRKKKKKKANNNNNQKAQLAVMKWLETEQKRWTKLERLQKCHELLFDLLHAAYDTVHRYRTTIYNTVADILGISYIVSTASAITNTHSDEKHDQYVEQRQVQTQKELTQYMCRSYLRQYYTELFHYYQTKLEGPNQCQLTLQNWIQANSRNGQSSQLPLKDGIKIVIRIDKEQKIKNRNVSEIIAQFIENAKKWSWCAILQVPELELFPKLFTIVNKGEERVRFNENIHKKSFGSENKSQLILYCVWPSLSRRGDPVKNTFIEVVVRD
ncbi:hypothetical protein RFI_13273 [Reticulomyxa filosa]|uniref:Mitochondria-eating protein C-terminal domain-containing protein n=1 Tax=Reticulomyxa filosa TaxID=46433 RepID=X6NEZ0_RETFI|nr:hypothetical protein RFI_13273 [Reticulomyxa filosa]|eukprot:ETO23887.1 hypothetical protein RFI_13273 [Reticulomyxa filosa]